MKSKFQAKRQTYVKEMRKNIKENTEQDKQDSLFKWTGRQNSTLLNSKSVSGVSEFAIIKLVVRKLDW